MRSFVLTRGKTTRFWNILLHKAVSGYTTSSGTTGRGTQETVHSPDWPTAQAEVDRLVAEKVAEGYVETTDNPWNAGFDSPLRQSLESALAENSDDRASHMAYADHLIELGDPRGEFIQVQLALEDESLPAPQRKKLKQRETALRKKHERSWLGSMAGFWIDTLDTKDWQLGDREPHGHTWRRGWIDSLTFHCCSPHSADAVKKRTPLLRCLRELRILSGRYDDDRFGYSTLSGAGILGNVRVFQVGHSEQNYIRDTVHAGCFYEQMPHLEELYLRNGETPFTDMFPNLRQLTAHAGWTYPLRDLAKNKSLKNLTHLSLWPHGMSNDDDEVIRQNEDGGWARISRSGAVALFRSPNFPKLQYLVLRNSDIGDKGIRDLVASSLLKRLKSLDLLGGCVTDAGARVLAECPDLRNLEALNLSENMLTGDGIAALRATGVPLKVASQFGPDALETREYLFSGDCE
jgi:uncharacterized protein (TIGR02996 family)